MFPDPMRLVLLLRATLCPEIATSYQGESRLSAEQVSPSRQQEEEAADLSLTPTPRHARAETLVAGARSSSLRRASTARHQSRARPGSCSSSPSGILHTQLFVPSVHSGTC